MLHVVAVPLEPQTELMFDSVSDVDVDEDGVILLLTRNPAAVVRYGPSGEYLGHWGLGEFVHPHGLSLCVEVVHVVDQFAHEIRVFTTEGRELDRIGAGVASDTGYDPSSTTYVERYLSVQRGGPPFNNPTKSVVAADGFTYVADGYGNARIHCFDPECRLVRSWGEPGSGPGQFRLPHGLCVTDDLVLVADRENDRIQTFDRDGAFVAEWTDVQRPAAIEPVGSGGFLVGELARSDGQYSFARGTIRGDWPARVSLVDPKGRVVARRTLSADDCPGVGPVRPHGLSTLRDGRVFVADLARGHRGPLVAISLDAE